jgi:ABC-type antimicrobial peptide transport system permease subunit
MIKNLFKIAFRNLLKSKTFSLINILGLAFGLCCALLISLWVIDEYSIDNYHTKKDKIFSVIAGFESTSGWQYWDNTPGPLAEVLKKDISGIETVVRLTHPSQKLFKQEHQNFEEWGVSSDVDFFEVFDFPLIQGDAKTALSEPSNIVISKELADKLFPNANAFNQTITINDWGDDFEYKITGVLEEIPDQSTLKFDFITSYEAYLNKRPWNAKWDNYNDRTFVLLEDNVDQSNVSNQIVDLISKNHTSKEADNAQLFLYAFKDMYLQANLSKGLDAEGRIVYVRIFSIIALVILLIACINFMSLSTARAGKRAKEVGVRKATGATRKSLIWQFLGESVFISIISGALAITMSDLLMVFFNQLTGKSLQVPYTDITFMMSTIGLCVFTGVLAGIYPAIYLSGFNPSKVLKGAVNDGKSLSGFRRVLVIAQFSMSITFVITTMIVYSQLQFVLNKDLGLNKENLLYHDLNAIMGNREAYRNEILQIPGVASMSSTSSSPLNIGNTTSFIEWKGKEDGEEIYFHVIQTDQYFVETFGATLLEGNGYSQQSDSTVFQVLINEEAAQVMFLEDPIGARLKVWGLDAEVVGLVKDYHHQRLDKEIDPIIMLNRTKETWRNYIAINGDVNNVIKEIGEVYGNFETNYPFDYGFIDEQYAKTYSRVDTMGKLSNIFAFVTIFVSCLGLFGLASYMTEQRKKETGIRKVMGASVFGLTTMFTRSFLGLILISFIISAPIAWYLASQWLSDFAFKIELGVQPFIIGGLSAMIISVATVSYHTIKVAIANPVDSLKYE